jgi:hypothetical protein
MSVLSLARLRWKTIVLSFTLVYIVYFFSTFDNVADRKDILLENLHKNDPTSGTQNTVDGNTQIFNVPKVPDVAKIDDPEPYTAIPDVAKNDDVETDNTVPDVAEFDPSQSDTALPKDAKFDIPIPDTEDVTPELDAPNTPVPELHVPEGHTPESEVLGGEEVKADTPVLGIPEEDPPRPAKSDEELLEEDPPRPAAIEEDPPRPAAKDEEAQEDHPTRPGTVITDTPKGNLTAMYPKLDASNATNATYWNLTVEEPPTPSILINENWVSHDSRPPIPYRKPMGVVPNPPVNPNANEYVAFCVAVKDQSRDLPEFLVSSNIPTPHS